MDAILRRSLVNNFKWHMTNHHFLLVGGERAQRYG